MNEDEIEQYKAEIQRKGGDVSGMCNELDIPVHVLYIDV